MRGKTLEQLINEAQANGGRCLTSARRHRIGH